MVETMLKLHEIGPQLTAYSLRPGRGRDRRRLGSSPLTADSLRLAAFDGCSGRNTPEPLAARRKPTDLPDALAYELYGLTEGEIRAVEGET
jgi:hypothetical protein